jgi:hypothetical protein
VRIGLIEDTLTKMVRKRELASRYSITATNTVENTKVVIAMELLKQSSLAAIFHWECSKTVDEMDIIHISSRVEAHRLVSSKMMVQMAMPFTDTMMEQHIMGSTIKIKERDTESISMSIMMCMMDSGKKAKDQVKQYGQMLKQDKLRDNFGRMTRK